MFSGLRKTPHLQQTDWQGYRLAPRVGDRDAGNANPVLAAVGILLFTRRPRRCSLLPPPLYRLRRFEDGSHAMFKVL
jgi:hypothetical protein